MTRNYDIEFTLPIIKKLFSVDHVIKEKSIRLAQTVHDIESNIYKYHKDTKYYVWYSEWTDTYYRGNMYQDGFARYARPITFVPNADPPPWLHQYQYMVTDSNTNQTLPLRYKAVVAMPESSDPWALIQTYADVTHRAIREIEDALKEHESDVEKPKYIVTYFPWITYNREDGSSYYVRNFEVFSRGVVKDDTSHYELVL